MTFSGHGPYTSANYMANKNIQEVKDILGDDADKYNDMADKLAKQGLLKDPGFPELK